MRGIVIRLLDYYNLHVDIKSACSFSVCKWKERCLDNNFRFANYYRTYNSLYRLPDFELFKVYYRKRCKFNWVEYCIIIVSDNEAYFVQLVM